MGVCPDLIRLVKHWSQNPQAGKITAKRDSIFSLRSLTQVKMYAAMFTGTCWNLLADAAENELGWKNGVRWV